MSPVMGLQTQSFNPSARRSLWGSSTSQPFRAVTGRACSNRWSSRDGGFCCRLARSRAAGTKEAAPARRNHQWIASSSARRRPTPGGRSRGPGVGGSAGYGREGRRPWPRRGTSAGTSQRSGRRRQRRTGERASSGTEMARSPSSQRGNRGSQPLARTGGIIGSGFLLGDIDAWTRNLLPVFRFRLIDFTSGVEAESRPVQLDWVNLRLTAGTRFSVSVSRT
jgi:hypothetical protein